MEGTQQRIVAVVDEAEDASRAALQWAARNLLRPGDSVTLLYAHPSSRSRNRRRALRLKGFQLAVSLKDVCCDVPEVKVEIIVKEGDQVAELVGLVNEIRAGAIILGLHDGSCLYRLTPQNLGIRNLGCRVIAVKQQHQQQLLPNTYHGYVTIEFTQVELARLSVPPRKVMYRILPAACSWRRPRRRKGRAGGGA